MPRLLLAPAFLLPVFLLPILHATPTLDALFPAGGRIGQHVEVTAVGEFQSWPVEAWTDHPDLIIEPTEKKGRFRFTLAKGAEPRPALVRLLDANGSSAAKPFVLSTTAETREAEPNDHRTKAQDLNATLDPKHDLILNGILKKGDTDFLRIHLDKGQTLHARLHAYALGSLIDPFLRLLSPNGQPIALASDSHNLDPVLLHRADVSGVHYLQLFAVSHPAATSVAFAGSDSSVYRLHLSLRPTKPVSITADERENALPEQNGSRLLPEPPVSIAATLAEAGETDSYLLPAKKGKTYLVSIEAQRLQLPTDPVLTVHRTSGALLKETDDSTRNRFDADYSLKAPTDGLHILTVRDRFLRGGPAHRYRLSVTLPNPDLLVTIDKAEHVLEANGTTQLKLKLDRKHGHARPLRFEIRPPLPIGLTLEDANASASAKTATLTLRASLNTQPLHHPFRLHLLALDEDNVTKETDLGPVSHSYLTSQARGDYLVNQTTQLHLTVKLPPPPKKPEEEEEDEVED